MRILALLFLLASPLSAQRIPPGKAVGVTREARAQLDSIARITRETRREQVACVVTAGTVDSLYVIGKVGPAKNLVGSDDTSISAIGDLCEWWQPVLHSHILDNGWLYTPSEIDRHTTAVRDVFGLLLSVEREGWRLKAYP